MRPLALLSVQWERQAPGGGSLLRNARALPSQALARWVPVGCNLRDGQLGAWGQAVALLFTLSHCCICKPRKCLPCVLLVSFFNYLMKEWTKVMT